jgi:hypothetical protein
MIINTMFYVVEFLNLYSNQILMCLFHVVS